RAIRTVRKDGSSHRGESSRCFTEIWQSGPLSGQCGGELSITPHPCEGHFEKNQKAGQNSYSVGLAHHSTKTRPSIISRHETDVAMILNNIRFQGVGVRVMTFWRSQMTAVPRRLKRIEVYCPEYETTATIRINDAHSSGTNHLEADYRSPDHSHFTIEIPDDWTDQDLLQLIFLPPRDPGKGNWPAWEIPA